MLFDLVTFITYSDTKLVVLSHEMGKLVEIQKKSPAHKGHKKVGERKRIMVTRKILAHTLIKYKH